MHRFAAVMAVLVMTAMGVGAGCARQDERMDLDGLNYDLQLPPGELALRRITDPSKLPDLAPACSDQAGLAEAVEASLRYLAKPSSRGFYPYGRITHEQVVASLRHFQGLLARNLPAEDLAAALYRDFDVYTSVGCDGRGTVLFTGYYTPIFDACPVRTGRFQYPLYRVPPGLVKLPDGSPATPMPDRRAIESGNLYAGNELVWLADPFEAYVAHIQGSAKLRMPDGQLVTVGYAANNGHEYQSIRAALVEQGKIRQRAGLPSMLAYFRQHPDEVREWTWQNPRYVFFDYIPDGRPRGSLNEPVTPWRSIATDKTIFPRAGIAYVDAPLPQDAAGSVIEARYRGFALDQDTGGAIRAPGRCDVYMGVGPDAGRLAGRAQNEGRLYYLFLKPALLPSLAPEL